MIIYQSKKTILMYLLLTLLISWPTTHVWRDIYIYITVIRDPRVYQSLAGSSIYSSGQAPQRTTTSVGTPTVCMTLFHLHSATERKPTRQNIDLPFAWQIQHFSCHLISQ